LILDTDHFSTRLRLIPDFSQTYKGPCVHNPPSPPILGRRKYFWVAENIPTRSPRTKTVDIAKARAQNRAPDIKSEHHFVG